MIRPFLLAILFSISLAGAQTPFPLWPNGAPGAKGERPQDIPTLTAYPVKDGSGAAIVVCPGGGYEFLAADHEGIQVAEWLNQNGINAFVLKYRLGSDGYKHPSMLQDVSRAIRTVRSEAADWNIDPDRIGVMGFSAGGHLASTMITHFDGGDPRSNDPIEHVSSRPDIGILCYPVITMGEFTHEGSRRNLLGEHPASELIELLSNEKQVKDDTPPTFLWHTAEDTVVPVENSLLFAQALAARKIPFALHIFEKGQHGMGLGSDAYAPDQRHPWADDLLYWLREQDFAK